MPGFVFYLLFHCGDVYIVPGKMHTEVKRDVVRVDVVD